MTGLRQTFFAALATFLRRRVARVPLGITEGVMWLADRCEERAR